MFRNTNKNIQKLLCVQPSNQPTTLHALYSGQLTIMCHTSKMAKCLQTKHFTLLKCMEDTLCHVQHSSILCIPVWGHFGFPFFLFRCCFLLMLVPNDWSQMFTFSIKVLVFVVLQLSLGFHLSFSCSYPLC